MATQASLGHCQDSDGYMCAKLPDVLVVRFSLVLQSMLSSRHQHTLLCCGSCDQKGAFARSSGCNTRPVVIGEDESAWFDAPDDVYVVGNLAK
jgi:hypothetical protein